MVEPVDEPRSLLVCKICKRAVFGYFRMGLHIGRSHPDREVNISQIIKFPQKIKGS